MRDEISEGGGWIQISDLRLGSKQTGARIRPKEKKANLFPCDSTVKMISREDHIGNKNGDNMVPKGTIQI